MKKKNNTKLIGTQVIIEGSLHRRILSSSSSVTFSSTDNKIMRSYTCLIGKYCRTWKVSFNARH